MQKQLFGCVTPSTINLYRIGLVGITYSNLHDFNKNFQTFTSSKKALRVNFSFYKMQALTGIMIKEMLI
ncbi:Putative protein [Zobellia galactanivorans]|uniref:Uncharacterized protein n=1 Tax=Zobellia galactanivorans (strain DSM 12802 / CCUG 47099 / CIP 106680 / NCIMB 13871 / Dsij) TaxID=63186 RepID=G0L4Z4_ZOBGA|nr:Putative protein [Zobellia galactanivorans]